MPNDPQPLAGVIMGSKSDWETMAAAAEILTQFGVTHECRVVSAHRTPEWMTEYAREAEGRGLEVIIAGAGGAAHLPGMVAGHTLLPVIGVPIQSKALNGLDSLLSIVQMPAGVPVATMAIGKAGATNAGLLAVAILAAHTARPARATACLSAAARRTSDERDAGLNVPKPILPGSTIGVFGSGQLGRMLALAARAMGYRIHTFSPEHDSPTGQVADREVCAPYDDLDAVRDFVRGVDVVTFEFENVSSAVADVAEAAGVPVRPGGRVLYTTQQRLREKEFLAQARLPVTPFAAVHSLQDLARALDELGVPAILKTAAFGYDGKGQIRIDHPQDAASAWQAIGQQAAILERVVDFGCEVSVVAARGVDGSYADWGVIENSHRNHILDLSVAPALLAPRTASDAAELSREVLENLDVVGVLCVEMFVDRRGGLLINELAPRPHNSGHLTVDAAITSQFEQQLRAICGLPLGSTEMLRPAAMANLLGDLWQNGEPDWRAACAIPGVKLHLYGKQAARAGRKMGHLTALAGTIEAARERVLSARRVLVSGHGIVNRP